MPRGYDMLADMFLLKSCTGVAEKETASLSFPTTAIQKIFQIFYTKVYGGVSVRFHFVYCLINKMTYNCEDTSGFLPLMYI